MGHKDSDIRSRVYSGAAGPRAFVFVAEDAAMAGGDKPIAAGNHCVIDPDLAARPGRIALVRINNGRPVLRRIMDDGSGLVLIAEDPRIRPRDLTADVEIIGAVRTSYYPPEEDD